MLQYHNKSWCLCRAGEIIFDDEIPTGDEIRPDAGWGDLISPEHSDDFIGTADHGARICRRIPSGGCAAAWGAAVLNAVCVQNA